MVSIWVITIVRPSSVHIRRTMICVDVVCPHRRVAVVVIYIFTVVDIYVYVVISIVVVVIVAIIVVAVVIVVVVSIVVIVVISIVVIVIVIVVPVAVVHVIVHAIIGIGPAVVIHVVVNAIVRPAVITLRSVRRIGHVTGRRTGAHISVLRLNASSIDRAVVAAAISTATSSSSVAATH